MEGKDKIIFETGVGTVTGADFLLETSAGTRVLVDCGMVQGEKAAEEANYGGFGYDPASIRALFVTHAHLDHVGRIPKLVKEGFNGAIYSTAQTRDLARLVLEDAVGIIAHEAEQDGRQPLYGLEDVQRAFPLWKTLDYHVPFKFDDGLSVLLKDAGHILGSSMFEFNIGGTTKILFTGDLGNSPHPLLRDTEPIGSDVDYLVMESVYGDRNHESRDDRTTKLANVVNETMDRGGTLVIPAFALDRSQVLLYELNNLVRDKKVPSVPVFFDSPMAEKATAVYAASTELFNPSARKAAAAGSLFSFPHLRFVEDQRESQVVDRLKQAKIIMAGSGMSVGGRVINHEAHYLSDPKSTILLVGYQSPGSLGRELAEGAKKVRIHGETVHVNAKIETLYGFSAHKDGDHLVKFVATAMDDSGKSSLKEVFVVMGEPGASMHLAQRLNDELDANAIVPERGKAYDLQA